MSDLFGGKMPVQVNIDKQIACARREVTQRKRVYPRLIENGKMTQAFADEQIVMMEAIVETLRGVRDGK